MKNLWQEKNGVYEIMPGANITAAIAEAILLSAKKKRSIRFKFNGVLITVRSDSDPKLIYRDWSRALNGYIDKNVGPYPNPILTDEEKVSDARIEAENKRRRQERQAQYEAEVRKRREAVEARLANAPEMELANEKAWREFKEKNQDFYGASILVYAERWARLMQLEMAGGKSLEEVAEATSRESDLEGITGFMYGCAVSMLAHCWKHGERLRRWHNLKIQIGNEGEKANQSGGVLNPALLNIF